MARPAIHSVLFDMIMHKWEDGEWSIEYHLHPDKADAKLLAKVDDVNRVVHVYPHPNGFPVEKTGLHEAIHVAFDLDGRKEHEAWCYYLEEWLWRRLGKKQRQALHNLFVEPLKT